MASTTRERHHHHKHSKHKHKHKHKHGHHHHRRHSKHKKKRTSHRERQDGKTPEIRVNERELQTALQSLEEAILEQCVQSDSHSSTGGASDIDATPSSLNPSIQPEEPDVSGAPEHTDRLKSPCRSEYHPTNVVPDTVTVEEETQPQLHVSVVGQVSCETHDSPASEDNLSSEEGCKEKSETRSREKLPAESGGEDDDRDDSSASSVGAFGTESESSSSDSDSLQLGRNLGKRREEKKEIRIKIGETLQLASSKVSQQIHHRRAKTEGKTSTASANEKVSPQILQPNSERLYVLRQMKSTTETKLSDSKREKQKVQSDSDKHWPQHTHRETATGRVKDSTCETEREISRHESESENMPRQTSGATHENVSASKPQEKKEERARDDECKTTISSESTAGTTLGPNKGVMKDSKLDEGEKEEKEDVMGVDALEGEGDGSECEERGEREEGGEMEVKHSINGNRKKKKLRKHSKRDRHSLSNSRSPSRSRSRIPSRSRRSSSHSRRSHHSRRQSRSHSGSRSRSPYHSRSRWRHSRSPYHSRRRDHTRDRHSRSPYRSTGSYSRGRSDRSSRCYRSRTRSRSLSRGRSRTRSRSPYSRRRGKRRRSYSSKSHSKSRSPEAREKRASSRDDESGGGSKVVKMETVVKEMAAKAKQVRIDRFTALCVDLQKRQEREGEGEEVPEEETAVRAPFNIADAPAFQSGLVLHNKVWKTPNQIITESNLLQTQRPLTAKFPVSSGVDHQQKENTLGGRDDVQENSVFSEPKSVSMGDLVMKRLEASQRLQQHPEDVEAQQMLAYVEHQASVWTGSQVKPGQFTGKKGLNPLTPEDHKTGIQAWVKKDMFKGLAPVLSGFGIKMLKKMGWNEGQSLGRMGTGVTEPIPMSVKVDRAGLSSALDKVQPIVPASAIKGTATTKKSAHLVEGKHPVSALQEICAKKHWDPPHYEMVNSSGPSHHMSFLCKVTVPLGTFQPAEANATKKQAKAQAALACLQGLGFVKE